MEEAVKKRIDAELEAMALEDRRSREVRLAPRIGCWRADCSLDFHDQSPG